MYAPLALQNPDNEQQPQAGHHHHHHHQQQQQPISTAVHPTTAVVQPVQPVQFVVARQPRSPVESYDSVQSMVASIILIITGVLSIVFNAIALGVGEIIPVNATSHGIWCGVLVSRPSHS